LRGHRWGWVAFRLFRRQRQRLQGSRLGLFDIAFADSLLKSAHGAFKSRLSSRFSLGWLTHLLQSIIFLIISIAVAVRIRMRNSPITALLLLAFTLVVHQTRADWLVSSQSDPTANSILRYSDTGAFLGVFASDHGIADPLGMTFGPDGNLYL